MIYWWIWGFNGFRALSSHNFSHQCLQSWHTRAHSMGTGVRCVFLHVSRVHTEPGRLPACVRKLRTSPYPRYSRLSVGYPGSLLELCLSGESLCMGFVKHMWNALSSSKGGKQSAVTSQAVHQNYIFGVNTGALNSTFEECVPMSVSAGGTSAVVKLHI